MDSVRYREWVIIFAFQHQPVFTIIELHFVELPSLSRKTQVPVYWYFTDRKLLLLTYKSLSPFLRVEDAHDTNSPSELPLVSSPHIYTVAFIVANGSRNIGAHQ